MSRRTYNKERSKLDSIQGVGVGSPWPWPKGGRPCAKGDEFRIYIFTTDAKILTRKNYSMYNKKKLQL
jgi:hypothetical protein